MGRGKIEIKKIENATNRQVTYSKRRNGIFKKAQELTVLCDAKISIIMFSTGGKLHEYISPSTTTKTMYDQYQRLLGIDIWSTHYERMQESFKKLKEINNRLRREIRQRMGDELDDLSMSELCCLQEKMADSLTKIRERKNHAIKTQTNTCKKKVRSLENRHETLLMEFEAKVDDLRYGLAKNGEGDDSALEFANGVSNLYAFRLQQSQPNLQHEGAFAPYDLRLA